jgi:hypothetical protein
MRLTSEEIGPPESPPAPPPSRAPLPVSTMVPQKGGAGGLSGGPISSLVRRISRLGLGRGASSADDKDIRPRAHRCQSRRWCRRRPFRACEGTWGPTDEGDRALGRSDFLAREAHLASRTRSRRLLGRRQGQDERERGTSASALARTAASLDDGAAEGRSGRARELGGLRTKHT